MPSIQHQDYKDYSIVAMATPADVASIKVFSGSTYMISPITKTSLLSSIKRNLRLPRPWLPKQRALMQRVIELNLGLTTFPNKDDGFALCAQP